ncbi:MAG: class I SAM-dependent methyltransferase [Pseudomonadota bacterium]|nr:class I SAM-dependent methyltransferase [Pseudomonadota bacterium]
MEYEPIFQYSQPDQYETSVGVTLDNYARQWVKCLKCGFFYSRFSRDPFILGNIYSETYREKGQSWRSKTTEEIFYDVLALPDKQSESKKRVAWLKTAINEINDQGLIVLEKVGLRMLDIGGGAGVFAHLYSDDLWSAFVVDPASGGKFLEEKHGINYTQTDYKAGLFEHKFHLISLIYVLEHLTDPAYVLTTVKKDLTQNGLVFVEVPDACAFDNLPPEDDIFNSCHLWMFEPNSITALFKECGFKILKLERGKTFRGHYSLSVIAKAA